MKRSSLLNLRFDGNKSKTPFSHPLIPYNLTGVEFERSPDSTIDQFLETLHANHLIATTRRTMSSDIAAGCGQLIVLTNNSKSG